MEKMLKSVYWKKNPHPCKQFNEVERIQLDIWMKANYTSLNLLKCSVNSLIISQQHIFSSMFYFPVFSLSPHGNHIIIIIINWIRRVENAKTKKQRWRCFQDIFKTKKIIHFHSWWIKQSSQVLSQFMSCVSLIHSILKTYLLCCVHWRLKQWI